MIISFSNHFEYCFLLISLLFLFKLRILFAIHNMKSIYQYIYLFLFTWIATFLFPIINIIIYFPIIHFKSSTINHNILFTLSNISPNTSIIFFCISYLCIYSYLFNVIIIIIIYHSLFYLIHSQSDSLSIVIQLF